MNCIERFRATMNGTVVDRPPVMPILLMQGARALGLSLSEYLKEPSLASDGQLALLERFPLDAVFSYPHTAQDLLAWGSVLEIHDDQPPSIVRRATHLPERLADCRVPDPCAHEYLAATLENAQRLKKSVGGKQLVVGAVLGPLSLPSLLLGPQVFLDLLRGDPAIRARTVPRIMERMIEFSSGWAHAQLEAGCDLVLVMEVMMSTLLLDEHAFLSCAHPALRSFCTRSGGTLALQLLGPSLQFLPHLRALPISAFALAEEDSIDSARRALGAGKALIGATSTSTLIEGSQAQVEEETRRLIAFAGPGLIIGSRGPELPWEVPESALDGLFRAARARRPELAVTFP